MATRFIIDTSTLPREETNELRKKLDGFSFITNPAFNSSRDIVSLDVIWNNNDSVDNIIKVMGIPASCPITKIT